MDQINLLFAWIWMLAGMILGAGLGLFFHRPDWLGGYDAWPRRMVRLAHIAFFGTGLLNLAVALTIRTIDGAEASGWLAIASPAMLLGGLTMPIVCLLAAWRRGFRHLFVIPVLGLMGGTVALLIGGYTP